jgi:hypothetical protein
MVLTCFLSISSGSGFNKKGAGAPYGYWFILLFRFKEMIYFRNAHRHIISFNF